MSFKIIFNYRVLLLLLTITGLALQIYPDEWFQLTYYTLQSNIAVACCLIVLISAMLQQGKSSLTNPTILRLKGATTIAIALTLLVYHFMLAPIAKPEDFYTPENFLQHYIVPIGFILDWLMIDQRRHYRYFDPLLWTLFPLLYTVYALIRGYIFQIPIPDQQHSPYPYFFVDINQLGWSGFFIYFIIILTGYILLGYFMLIIKGCQKKAQVEVNE